jgi:hypothetical protein
MDLAMGWSESAGSDEMIANPVRSASKKMRHRLVEHLGER